jgi:pyruvate/oxaloacetate carboxyltransferase
MSIQDKAYELRDFEWKNRLVLIGGENLDMIENQALEFLKMSSKNNDRKLLIFQWNDKYQAFYEREKDYILKESNYKNDFEIRLYGLDGGVKDQREEMVRPQRIYDQIDSMPMRIRELRNKSD